jgi:hypothetical protein
LGAGVLENDKENEKAWLAKAERVTGVYVTARRVTARAECREDGETRS